MKVQTSQRDKIIDVLEQLAEDAGYESYESGGEENIDNVYPYYKKICRILNLTHKNS